MFVVGVAHVKYFSDINGSFNCLGPAQTEGLGQACLLIKRPGTVQAGHRSHPALTPTFQISR